MPVIKNILRMRADARASTGFIMSYSLSYPDCGSLVVGLLRENRTIAGSIDRTGEIDPNRCENGGGFDDGASGGFRRFAVDLPRLSIGDQMQKAQLVEMDVGCPWRLDGETLTRQTNRKLAELPARPVAGRPDRPAVPDGLHDRHGGGCTPSTKQFERALLGRTSPSEFER